MSKPIPAEVVENIRKNTDIVDLISRYCQLRSRGHGKFWTSCPFHRDPLQSLVIYRQRQVYRCDVCGEKGDIFSFIMKAERLSFPEAIRFLQPKE